jgi:hypothetical protein
MLRSDRETFAAADVRRLALGDSLVNGVLVGLGVGLTAAIASPYIWCDPPDPECSPRVFLAIGLPSIAAGVTAGALVDQAIRRTVYRQSPGSVGVRPLLGPGTGGAAITITF